MPSSHKSPGRTLPLTSESGAAGRWGAAGTAILGACPLLSQTQASRATRAGLRTTTPAQSWAQPRSGGPPRGLTSRGAVGLLLVPAFVVLLRFGEALVLEGLIVPVLMAVMVSMAWLVRLVLLLLVCAQALLEQALEVHWFLSFGRSAGAVSGGERSRRVVRPCLPRRHPLRRRTRRRR